MHERAKRFTPGEKFLRSQQGLIEGEEDLVDLKDVVPAVGEEVFDDDVELAAGREGEARLHQQLPDEIGDG